MTVVYIIRIMGFWKKVEIEMNYYGATRKELSAKSGVPMTTINRAMKHDTKPFALDALKISKALSVSLERLLDYTEDGKKNSKEKENELLQIEMYKKYHAIIEAIEKLPQKKQKTITEMIKQMVEFGK